jgi:hypothetical protein
MYGVTDVVTNVKLVIVHYSRLLRLPEKKQAAGEGVTLFGMEIRPFLAVFQNIVRQLNHK